MSEPKKLIPFFSRPLVLGVAALAWTVMVGAAVARYMVASGLVDEHALAQRADNLRIFRDRVVDALHVNQQVRVEEGGYDIDDPGGDEPPAAGDQGVVSRRLSLSLRKARSEGLLPQGDPAANMDEPSLAEELDQALAKVRTTKAMQTLLPYFSECGLLMLLGIAFGLASKMAVKIAVVLGVVLLAGMQYFAWQGVLDVNWGAMAAFMHETLLNVTPQGDLGEVLKEKFPSLASLGVGAYLGVRG